MCCEECPKYEKCEENNSLKDNCCPKCPEYNECAGLDDRDKDSSRDSSRDRDVEEYF